MTECIERMKTLMGQVFFKTTPYTYMCVRAKELGGGTILPDTDRNCPTQKEIALKNHYYSFKTNKPVPIAPPPPFLPPGTPMDIQEGNTQAKFVFNVENIWFNLKFVAYKY